MGLSLNPDCQNIFPVHEFPTESNALATKPPYNLSIGCAPKGTMI